MADRGLFFTCLVYPDSAPADWLSKLEQLHILAAVSPLHDKDVLEDGTGELKKPHYHVVFKYSSLKSFRQVSSDFDFIGGVYPHSESVFLRECLVRSPDVIFRYLVHADNPEKAQYSSSDVLTFGGLDYIEECSNNVSISKTIGDICDWCCKTKTTQFMRLCLFAKSEHPDWFMVIVKYTFFFRSFMTSISQGVSSVDGFYLDDVDCTEI